MRLRMLVLAASVTACQGANIAPGAEESTTGEWTYFGGDHSFTRYSALAQIDRKNVADLRIVWRRPGRCSPLPPGSPWR